MTRYIHTIFSFLLITLLLASCSSEESKEPKEKEESTQVVTEEKPVQTEDEEKENVYEVLTEAPIPPVTVEEIISQPVGELAGMNHQEDIEVFVERLKELPELKEADKEVIEQYWNTVYHLFAEDFPSPQDLIDSWKTVSFGSPDMEDTRYQFKEQFNVEIILDASGSMAGYIGNKTKMEIAKETIQNFTSNLPEGANIGLRVYGHKGSGSDSDKSLSCSSSELIYEIRPFEQGNFHDALNRFAPAGWTPTGLALNEAAKDLAQYPGEQNTNIIYLVSDGIATCDDDPVTAAKNIADSNIQPIINVIGFDVDADGQNQLKDLANAAGGIYSNATSQDQLQSELDKAQDMAKKWEEWKASATNEAKHAHYNQFFDALRFQTDWSKTNQQQSNNIWYTLIELKDEGYISEQVYDSLNQLRKQHFDLVVQEGQKIYEDLRSINEDNLQDMLKQIEEKYQQQDT